MKKNLLLAFLGMGIGGIGFGLITPVSVLLLEQNGAPGIITGSVTAMGYLGVILFSSLTGILIDRFNVKRILLVGLFIWGAGALLHIFWRIYPLLYVIKFLMGIGGTFIFVSTEVTINYFSDETNRGRNIGLYAVLLSIGIAIGTLLMWTLKFADWVPFVIGSTIMFIVLILQIIFFEETDVRGAKKKASRMPLSDMPLMSLTSAAVYGLFESSVIVVIPLFGLRNHFSASEVAYLLASFVLGGVVLVYFMGTIADRVSKYKLLLIISASLGFFFLLPSISLHYSFLLAVFFVIGGIIPTFYTVGLNYTMEIVRKEFMAQANGHYTMMYGVGTLCGPLLGALLMDINKQTGYWLFASVLSLCFFLLFSFNKGGYSK